jgi:uncharacterized membrane protein
VAPGPSWVAGSENDRAVYSSSTFDARAPVIERSRLRWLPWLFVAVGIYVAVTVTFSEVRQLELVTNTLDLGVYQQAFWSAAHGRPFYEAPDWETGSYGSLLEIHSAFVLYAVVPIYAAFPNALTLFVVQSLVVGLAAVPLFSFAADVTGSSRRAFVAALLYLTWFPVVAGNLFDFHAEAFVPLAMFLVAYLWNRSLYGWGFLAAGLGFATFEVVPVFLFFLAAFFLLPPLVRIARHRYAGRLRPAGVVPPGRSGLSVEPGDHRRVWACLLLMVAAVGAYYLLFLIRSRLLEMAFGLAPFPANASGYPVGTTPGVLGLTWANLGANFAMKENYWLLAFATLGFLPLLNPRAWILPAPWVGFTLLSARPNYVVVGNQYGFLAASVVFPALVFGLARLDLTWLSTALGLEGDARPAVADTQDVRRRWRRPSSRELGLIAVLIALIAVSLLYTPLNPAMDTEPHVGFGAAYLLQPNVPSGFPSIERLVRLIPAGATVLASRDVFPLVADDENAYSLFSPSRVNAFQTPFGPNALPSFVALSDTPLSPLTSAPPWLIPLLFEPNAFGVRAVAWNGPSGVVTLFEAGYRASPEWIGPPPTNATYRPYAGLAPVGGAAVVSGAAPTGNGTAIISPLGSAAVFWTGPGADLLGGPYAAMLLVRAIPSVAAASGSLAVLRVTATGFGQSVAFSTVYSFSQVGAGNWTAIPFTFDFPTVALDLQVRGATLSPNVQVEVASLAM